MRKNDLQSRTINVLRGVLIFYVLAIHAYTSMRGAFDTLDYPWYRFISFLFSLEIAQIAVPGLFFLSGYLFYFRREPYRVKIRKEIRRLWIPYLLWNGIILAVYFVLQNMPSIAPYFSGNNLAIKDYSPLDFVRAFWDCGDWDEGNGTPILPPLWYVRNLILLGIFSPVIGWFVRVFRAWGVALLLIVWLLVPGQAFSVESVAFFAAGAAFSLPGKDFLPVFRRFSSAVFVVYPVLVAVNMAIRNDYYILALDRISFLAGIVFTTVLVSRFLQKYGNRHRGFYSSLRQLGFFVFAAHFPLMIFVERVALKLSAPLTDGRLLAIYFAATPVVALLCAVFYKMMRRAFPGVLGILTGQNAPEVKKKS